MRDEELPSLHNLYKRGIENGLAVTLLSTDHVKAIEPNVRCLAGIRVPSTGIVNYRDVCAKYAEVFQTSGGTIRTGTRFLRSKRHRQTQLVQTTQGDFESKFLINCGGLFSDRIARKSGMNPDAKIVPFRGEYYELKPDKRPLVNTLIYPVPNPSFPFLGVQLQK